MERISLYCHQLNITSKVKADVQNISGELIVSGVSDHTTNATVVFAVRPTNCEILFLQLDSATSLIQSARNLMGAVVQAVESAYVASTKYRQASGKYVSSTRF